MSERGTKTKSRILREAKQLFMQKGFTAVTMSDICEAAELSRGGLYRHYSSTKDVFTALLMSDKDNWDEELLKAMKAGVSAVKMLSFYFEQVCTGVSDGEGRLSLAIYEYGRTGQDEDHFLAKRYNSAVDMMAQVLQYGQNRREFADFDPRREAEHMVIFIDGLKTAAAGLSLPSTTIKQQLDLLFQRVIKE